MKGFIFFARVYACLILAVLTASGAQNKDPYPNYVVIGAFAHKKNAAHFTEDANKHNFRARFEMNPNRNLYYVYVLTTPDREQAIAEALKLRTETKYFDTWVYSGAIGKMQVTASGIQHQDFNPVTGKKMELVKSEQVQGHARADAGVSDSLIQTVSLSNNIRTGDKSNYTAGGNETDATNLPEGSESRVSAAQPPAPKRISEERLTVEEVKGKNFYFHLFRTENNEVVEGEVDAIDFEKTRKMATYPANTSVSVLMPTGKSKQISFLCQVFGYRKQQKEFDPADPAEDLYLDNKQNLVVPFELVRLQKGDIAIMYNVFFFKDAAIMRPESRYEVNNLLDLLNENPSYKIRIHGHTNGNASGKIIRMGEPENFYSLAGTKQGAGSAKKLSEERALVIKEYLISSGVSADRMQVKAWGGKKPIHDKHAVRANENVRVEIEILSE